MLKSKMLIIIFLLFYLSSYAQESHTYGPVREDVFATWLYNGSDDPYSWVDVHYCGHYFGDEVRVINKWTWDNSDIPIEAVVTEVNIKFKAKKTSHPQDLNISFHNIEQESGVNFYNECKTENEIYKTATPLTHTDGIVNFNKTFLPNDNTGVVEAINNAVQSGNYFFILGIKALGTMLNPAWKFWSLMAQLITSIQL
jgi:hypothetical protein